MKQVKKITLTSLLVLALVSGGCSGSSDKKVEAPAQKTETAQQAPAPEVKQAPPVETASAGLEGTVVETFDSGGYTYLQLDTGHEKLWAAVGEMKIAVGDRVTLENGPVMSNFHSKTLDRTFPEIIFSGGCRVAGAEQPHGGAEASSFSQALQGEGGMPKAPMGAEEVSGGSVKAITPAQEITVEKAEGDTGYRVEEVFAKAAELHGKKIKIRGKVVKVSPNIMGRNWLHLQDGSGSPMNNSHDLVITSHDGADVDAVILVEGVVAKDKDFGAGYFYPVIVEEAVISK